MLVHELWVDPEGLDSFVLAGPEGDAARAWLPDGSRLVWTVEAGNHFEAMTKYDAYRKRGAYTSLFEQDRKPYDDARAAVQRAASPPVRTVNRGKATKRRRQRKPR
jgi:hypothetical protein